MADLKQQWDEIHRKNKATYDKLPAPFKIVYKVSEKLWVFGWYAAFIGLFLLIIWVLISALL